MKQLEKCRSLPMPHLDVYGVFPEVLIELIHSMRDRVSVDMHVYTACCPTCRTTPRVLHRRSSLRHSFQFAVALFPL